MGNRPRGVEAASVYHHARDGLVDIVSAEVEFTASMLVRTRAGVVAMNRALAQASAPRRTP